MDYNFYQRKDESLSGEEEEWLDSNLERINQNENVLFIFQTRFEVIIFTDQSLYFPDRPSLNQINFSEILEFKITSDFCISISTKNKQNYIVVFVAAVDKVKVYLVLELLIKNFDKAKSTNFEVINKIFQDFTVLKHPEHQDQHKIPRVYLKQFGYKKRNQWMVSVQSRKEKFTRQKSVGSFTATTNVFDIESEDDRFTRMFETLNGEIENLYYEMLEDISNNSKIPDKCWEIIVQLTPNLMVRSDVWRDFVEHILKSPDRETFLEVTVSPLTNGTLDDLKKIKEKHFYKVINTEEISTSILNRILILFMNYIFYHLRMMDLVILEAPEGREFFTSDNPVNFIPNPEEGKLGLFSKETEVYFPLSKNYLAYFHYRTSNDKANKFRKLENRGVYKIEDVLTEEEYDNLIQDKILANSDLFIIYPLELKHRIA